MHEKLSSDTMLSTKGYSRGPDIAIFFFRDYILLKETGEINVQVLLGTMSMEVGVITACYTVLENT